MAHPEKLSNNSTLTLIVFAVFFCLSLVEVTAHSNTRGINFLQLSKPAKFTLKLIRVRVELLANCPRDN